MDPTRNPKTRPRMKSSTDPGSLRNDPTKKSGGSKPDTHSSERTEHRDEGSRKSTEEGTMATGTSTGQTTRGSYSTDPATGGGRYGDHSSGQFSVDALGQPGSDEPIDPKI
jgi:hypothetical protein